MTQSITKENQPMGSDKITKSITEENQPIKDDDCLVVKSKKRRKGRPRLKKVTQSQDNNDNAKVTQIDFTKVIDIKRDDGKPVARKIRRRKSSSADKKKPFNRMSNVCNLCGIKFETYDPKALAIHKK